MKKWSIGYTKRKVKYYIIFNSLENKNNTKSWVLSCPGCFTQVCYDCQQYIISIYIYIYNRHEIYKSQYRAVFVQNCNIDQNKIIQQKNMKIYNSMMGKEDKDIELEKKRICAELYFSVSCANCGCEIGVFDALEKVYHFFQVIPGSG